MSTLSEALKLHWSAQGLRCGPGVPEESLREFEDHHGVRLPADLRDYLAAANGMEEEEKRPFIDDVGFRFWPLGEFERVADDHYGAPFLADPASFFVFADHLCESAAYAIRLTADGKGGNPVIAIMQSPTVVADSFGGFVKRYLADHHSRLDLSAAVPLYCDPRKTGGLIQTSSPEPSHPLWDADLDQ